jgi:hypothetical protein
MLTELYGALLDTCRNIVGAFCLFSSSLRNNLPLILSPNNGLVSTLIFTFLCKPISGQVSLISKIRELILSFFVCELGEFLLVYSLLSIFGKESASTQL